MRSSLARIKEEGSKYEDKKVSWLLAAFVFVFSGTALGSVILSEDFEAIGAGGSLSAPWTWGVQELMITVLRLHGVISQVDYLVQSMELMATRVVLTKVRQRFDRMPITGLTTAGIKTMLRYEHIITAEEAALGTRVLHLIINQLISVRHLGFMQV